MRDRSTERKKLIEVALPLTAINTESELDKKLSAGHPTTLHYWWAPRPLPACRAIVFASLVDDPSSRPDLFPDEESQDAERRRLFELMRELIRWENRKNGRVLEAARAEIVKGTNGTLPTLFDPFCGRGLIPLEGQRLGLEVVAADVNPVAALIAKCLLEIVPRLLGRPPVNPKSSARRLLETSGTEGLADDVEYYGRLVLQRAEAKLRPFFPEYTVSPELARERPDLKPLIGQRLTVMAWLWARTVRCSNPACGCLIPLVGSFWLSQRGRRKWWLEPEVDRKKKTIRFNIRCGEGQAPPPTRRPNTGGTFRCLACGQDSDERHLEGEGRAGRIGKILMACIADGGRSLGRIYLPATKEHEEIASSARPEWRPDIAIPEYSQAMPTIRHGVRTWADFFTERQLLTLETLAQEIRAVHDVIRRDAVAAGWPDDGRSLENGGEAARAYAEAVTALLGIVLGKYANRSCSFSFWHSGKGTVEQPFAQQGFQKSWDFVESNPFCEASGGWAKAVEYPVKVIRDLYPHVKPGRVLCQPVSKSRGLGGPFLVITDPPYYDQIGYADLSDFFYIWLRRALAEIFPGLFATVLTPKEEELAAVRHRFNGSRREAEQAFVERLTAAFRELAAIQHEDYPLCFFYAYKQKESRSGDKQISTGWEIMLRALIEAGFCITGTWPIRSESTDTIKKGKSSLSTSVVLVCRKRPVNAPTATRLEFSEALRSELPAALRVMQTGNIAPVDFAQAAIGPGMAIYSRYSRILEMSGRPMSVRTALALINQILTEVLSEQEDEFDNETRWAIAWYEQHGFEEGDFGDAELLSKAKVTSVTGLVEAGIVHSRGRKVRLLRPEELAQDWDPERDRRPTVWGAAHHLLRVYYHEKLGDKATAGLLRKLGSRGELARDLAYRLFAIAEKKGRSQDAQAYNALVLGWPELARLAREPGSGTGLLFGGRE
jgi:putative DNA methylase